MGALKFNKPKMNDAVELKYCLYARKSTEADERQVQSLDSQIKEMERVAGTDKINITEVITESKSAKLSNQRDGYQKLLGGINEGRFNAILTWAPDRLSRNAGDLGLLVDLMDKGLLLKIRTHGQTFTNTPDEKFLLMILCSQAKLENDNRAKNVVRGLKAMCERGVRPGPVPIGYKVVRSTKFGEASKIMLDEERAPHVKKLFRYILEGYTGVQAWEYISEDGLRTRRGNKVASSVIYRILRDPFYYGEFEYPKGSGNFYQGSHNPLITKEIFEKVQEKIKISPKSAWGRKQFYFSKLIRCGKCGAMICGTECVGRGGKRYKYYRCNRSNDYREKCREKYIREMDLIESISKLASQSLGKTCRPQREIIYELEKVNRFSDKQISLEQYLKDILANGNVSEKAQVLRCLEGELVLAGGEIKVKN